MMGAAVVWVGAFLAILGGAISAPAAVLNRWQAAAGLGVLVAALGLVRLAPEGSPLGTVVLAGQAEGAPASSRVVIQTPGERREIFAVPFQRTVSSAPWALGGMAGLALLGLILARRSKHGRLAAVLPLVGAALAAGVFIEAARPAGGEAAVRAILTRSLPGLSISAFTVPTGGWVYLGGGWVVACAAAALLTLPVVLRGFFINPGQLAVILPLGAIVVLVGASVQLLAAGGPWWTAADGTVVAAALLVGGATFLANRPGLQAMILGIGGGLASLTFALGAA